MLSYGQRFDAAVAGMGFLGHLLETKQASIYKVRGELPSLSHPMYETIHTGRLTSEHGIVSNFITRLSFKPNIPGKGNAGQIISQLQIAPTVCKLLGLPIPETMKHFPIVQ